MQAEKQDDEQPSLSNMLHPFHPRSTTSDVCVVGCGPAGLALSAELAKQGLTVCLLGEGHQLVQSALDAADMSTELCLLRMPTALAGVSCGLAGLSAGACSALPDKTACPGGRPQVVLVWPQAALHATMAQNRWTDLYSTARIDQTLSFLQQACHALCSHQQPLLFIKSETVQAIACWACLTAASGASPNLLAGGSSVAKHAIQLWTVVRMACSLKLLVCSLVRLAYRHI